MLTSGDIPARESGARRPAPARPLRPAADDLPAALGPRRIGRRLAELGIVCAAVGVLVTTGPGLSTLRDRLDQAAGGWLVAGVGLEILSALSYVLIFRAVFCARMRWRLSYQIGMAEQGANSVLSVSGAGGLALGAWALRRGGMSAEHIGRRSVAFFFLTSLANVAVLIILAALYLTGLAGHDRNAVLTEGFGAAALGATVLVLALPRLLRRGGRGGARTVPGPGRTAQAAAFVRDALGQGIPDGLRLLRRHPVAITAGSVGFMAFDVAVLGACFAAFGYWPGIGVLLLGYLIGQLGGNVPVPGGIGGVDAGLIGTFALYHQPLAVTTAAVLVYHAVALWVPGLLGSVAFLQLRRTLHRHPRPAAMCEPLAEAIPAALAPAVTGRRPA